ncbi:Sfi1 spindle body protein-domain-containing protein [Naematelia encephala]|uniref:Sfi1 spindle body protein-domain-containing protein n=1 Tax=Naematelia encephala TaxID=71784 RepID=A0A1Y2BFC8_9TREE|nr:Sfi1 spindle body protein-domain-containing protein [Naematelia encephala]
MLRASTLSGLSSNSTTITDDVDLEVVQEIIERAPRSATTFPRVFEAYGQVLQEHGVSQASDTAYYNFLLKLGVIRAPTWGERWDLWRATHVKAPPSTPSRVASVRARVPFLASAGSDLDEGFTHEDDVRPSPRKVMAERSLEYDLLTFDPPPRTSTPVYAQESGYRSPPPLPPYSVSDISYLEVYEPEELDEDVQREMDAKADGFYETGLLGRCFDVWARASDWVQTTTRQIDTVRDGILLRQTLVRWRHQHERHLALPGTADEHRRLHLQSQALKAWIHRLKQKRLQERETEFVTSLDSRQVASSWQRWRWRAVERRTERWKRDMREREARFVSEKREELLRGVLQIWRGRARIQVMQRLADSHLARKDLRIFDLWRYRAAQQKNMAVAVAIIEGDLLGGVFNIWRRNAKLVTVEAELSSGRAALLLKRTWSEWRLRLSRRKMATDFAESHGMRSAFGRWRQAMRGVRTIEGKASLISRHRDIATVRDCFSIWRTRERGIVLQQALDVRLERKAMKQWTEKLGLVRGMAQKAVLLRSELEGRSVLVAFARWRDRLASHVDQTIKADLVFETHLVTAAVAKWKATSARAQENKVKADKAAAFFALRGAWKVWRFSLRVKRQNAWVEEKRVEETREVFALWRDAARRSKDDKEKVESFRSKSSLKLAGVILARWTERVVEIKSRELDVVDRRNTVLVERAMTRWITEHKRIAGLNSLLESQLDVKAEEMLRALLHRWRDAVGARKAQRLAVNRLQAERAQRLVAEAFETWRSGVRERQLTPLAEEVELKHEDALLFAVWDRWKGRSTMLPVISFERRRLLKMAWYRWKRALALVKAEQEAQAPKNRRLLEEAFDIWKDARASRAAKRALRSRTRFRPSFPRLSQDGAHASSEVGEPAYSRLRSEVRRGSEPDSLFNALRKTLPER